MVFKNVKFVLCPDCAAADERDRLEAMAYQAILHAEEAGEPTDHDEIMRQELLAETTSFADMQDRQDFAQWKAENDWEREHEGEDMNFCDDELERLELWAEQERAERPTPHSEYDIVF
jgi:hypothetical protein